MTKNIDGISIVIPALNEEHGISITLESIINHLESLQPAIPYEIVVVDDGSTDKTAAVTQPFPHVKTLRHPANAGYGRSLKDGINAASYDTIVITDADGTYPVQDIYKLCCAFADGFDMVVGARTGEFYRQSLFKSFLRRILQFIVEWACGKKIADINSGFRIFSKKEIQKYFFQLCDTFSFTTSLTLAYMMTGKFVSYIPTKYYMRHGKTHVRLLSDSIKTLLYIAKEILYFDPLKIFLLFACLWIAIGGIAFLASTFLGLKFGYYISILSIFSFFIMIGLGLLAEQIRQMIGSRDFDAKKK